MTRRRFLVGGLSAATLAGAAYVSSQLAQQTVPGTPSSARQFERPSGRGFVRYEDLYRSGDTITQALGRLSSATRGARADGTAYITFPEGSFEFSDLAVGGFCGIYVPPNCNGIWGSGPGSLGGSSGTVFTLRPRSWTRSSPAQATLQANACQMMYRGTGMANGVPLTFAQFQVAGTGQGDRDGRCYHGFTLKNPESPATVRDILVSGWYGDSGMPPGETFGFGISGGSGHRILRVQADGRREIDGPAYGAVGLSIENAWGAQLDECSAHHTRSTSLVLYQAFATQVSRFVHGPLDYARRVGTSQGINLERTDGTLFTQLQMRRSTFESSVPLYNISHSNDTYRTIIDGHHCSTVNGSLTIHGVSFEPLYSDGWFRVLTHHPYEFPPFSNGDTIRTPPVITEADSLAAMPYWWLHEGSAPQIVR